MHIEFEPGKLLNELKTSLPDVTDLVFRRKATEAGMLPSELLRDLVCEYGFTSATSARCARNASEIERRAAAECAAHWRREGG